MKKRIVSILLAALMLVSLLPLSALPAFAEEGVKYLSYNAATGAFEELTCTDYTTVTGFKEGNVFDATWTEGWYVVPAEEIWFATIIVQGNVNLILTDGCRLIIHDIEIENGSITIYAQSEGETAGNLAALGSYKFSGIGGNGDVTINGGNISATGGNGAAGIGCDGEVTINGGNISATGGVNGAGIGSAYFGVCGDITINGGTVTAKGGTVPSDDEAAAGIGSAKYGSCGDITINGGFVTAIGADAENNMMCTSGNGIGNAVNSACGKVTINGGYINVMGGKATALEAYCGRPFDAEVVLGAHLCVFDRIRDIMLVSDNSNEENYCDLFNSFATDRSGRPYVSLCTFENAIPDNAVKVYEYDDELGTIVADFKYIDYNSGEPVTSETRSLTSGWYKVDGEVTISGRLDITGDVHLILTDGCLLTVKEGIRLEGENRLSVYPGPEGTGQLAAQGNEAQAGIGTGIGGWGGALTVYGGHITAGGAGYTAGIGSAANGGGGTVTVYAGSVTAHSGDYAAGIGGGIKGWGGTVTVFGGSVTAYGGYEGAGIGAGANGGCTGGTVRIYGGKIRAVGGIHGAGIGGGYGNDGADIYINGGQIIAVGGEQAAAIGSGYYQGSGSISGGNIYLYDNVSLYNRYDDSVINAAYNSYVGPVNDTAVKDKDGRDTISVYALNTRSPMKQIPYLAYNTSAGKMKQASVDESRAFPVASGGKWDYSWYVLDSDVTIDDTIFIKGDVSLILKDGCKLEAKGGIAVNIRSSLTIYAQSDGENMGELISEGVAVEMGNLTVAGSAGIGGCKYEDGAVTNIDKAGDITIHGGKIEAIGKGGGAGIGGASGTITKILFTETETITECGNIIIYGGDITAVGSDGAAGIGVAKLCKGGSVSIYKDAKIHAISEATAGIKADTVTVYPGSAHDVIHVKQNNADIEGSPFTQTTVIGSLLGEGNVDVFPEAVHSFTGNYVDNGDGTHSRQCAYCDVCDDAKQAHSFTYVSDNNATCTADGTKTGTCAQCGATDTVTDIGSKTEHYFTYVDNGDGTHTQKCMNCDAVGETAAHEFIDGVCTCGEVCEARMKIRSASLHIAEDISVIYAAEIPEGYTDPYMVFTLNDRTYTVDTYTVNSEGQYCFELAAVTPQCMGDNISATLYATAGGCVTSVTKAEYSVRAYCVSMLAKTDDEMFITLLSDLLTYGAAAQTYTSYKTDALVTDGLDLSPSTFAELSGLKEEFVGTADPDTFWKSASLTLCNNVDMNLFFCTDSIEGLSVVLEINGRTETVTDFTPVDGEENIYQITYRGILATEFDLPVSASFCRDGVPVGNTLSYSVNTYICSKQNDSDAALAAMVQALYNYGATANTYYFERYLKQ